MACRHNRKQGGSSPDFWSRPPPQGIIFWGGVILFVLLTNAFWPTVLVLLAGGVYAYYSLTSPKQPRPRRRRRP